MRVSVLGPLSVESLDGTLGPRDRVVLAALAMACGDPVSGERLADALWGEAAPRSWNKVVQGCIVRLRRALGPTSIETRPLGYRLTIPPDDIDARRFERSLLEARELLALGAPERAVVTADEALALWRGRPFLDIEDWEPARIEARRLEELQMETEELRLDAALRSGGHREVLASARAAVDAAPTRERRWELLATALYRSGRQGDALRTLHEARAVLARELGLDPGPGIAALEQAILRQDPALAAAPVPPPQPSGSSPWPGLPAYGIDDAEEFFGRDAVVAACLDRLASEGVAVVVGPSGSGKSSVVRAGVAAVLRRSGRRVVVVTGGSARPLDALSALPRSGDPPVLVVDQCEEVVTSCPDANERRAYFDALIQHAARAPLVVALRADRVGDVSAHADFARLVERGLVLLGPMGEADLRTAIEGPARRAALLLEPGLVDLVVRDVVDEPGALPLMSHALRQTWARRSGRTLTVAAYRETGGIRGAVAQSAEAVYAEVDPEERQKLRELLLRLVASVDDGEPTRARVPRHVLAGDPAYDDLVERLVTARLLTSDGESVELAHEALARAWPRLRDWLEEDVDAVRVLRHLSVAAAGWDALGRPESELYRGVRLAQAEAWRSQAQPELTAVERSFLDASVEREAADLRTVQAQVARERRTVRRLRRLVAGVAVLAVVAVVASGLALNQRDRADDEARIAEARRLSAQGLVAQPYDRALLLAVEAVRLWDSEETRGNLLTTIGRSPRVTGVLRSGGPRLLDLEVPTGGQQAAVVDGVGDVTLYDLRTRDEEGTLGGDGVTYQAPTFSPDGQNVAVARMASACRFEPCDDYAVDVVAAADVTGRRTSYEGLGHPAADVTWSPDGRFIAAVPAFAFVEPVDNIAVWRVGRPNEPTRRLTLAEPGVDLRASPDTGPPGWVRFSPDGTRLYASGAGPTVAFDVATGQPIRSYGGAGAMALSPDGRSLAIAGSSTRVDVADTDTGQVRARLTGHDALVTAATFSPDGERVATTSNDETVAVWDAATGERLLVLEGHDGSVHDVAFSAQGSTLLTAGADRSVLQWDVDASAGLARSLVEGSLDVPAENVVLVSPMADSVAVLAERVHVLDVEAQRSTELVVEPYEVAWGAYSPDGDRLVTVGWDGSTKLWRTADGDLLETRRGRRSDNLGAVAFTADGRGVAVADADGMVVELDGESLEPTGRSVEVGMAAAGIRTAVDGRFAVTFSPPDPAAGTDVVFGDLDAERVERRVHVPSWGPRANFSPDGSHYAVGGFDGRLGVIDVATGELVGPRDPVHSGPIAWVTFSPDGTTLASMGFDGDLTLSNPDTARPRAQVQPGPVNLHASVGFAPDGHTAVIGYRDGTVLAYQTDPDAWVAHACRVAGRNLTDDEWRDAFGAEPRRDTCPAEG